MRLELSPLTIALMVAATAMPTAAQLPDPSDQTCPDAEALDLGAIVVCLAWMVEESENAPGDPGAVLAGGCWPQSWRTVYGSGEDKWTPLHGTNSPRYGKAEVVVESSQTLDMSIGFTWKGSGAQLKKSQTATGGAFLPAHNGESIVKYQSIEWKSYEKQYCGWDINWHAWEEGYRPRDYRPNGLIEWNFGNHEAADLATDADNSMRPSQSWSTADNTIGLDLRYVTPEIHGCFAPGESHWFGEESVYSVAASMTFGGVLEAGATRSDSESSTFRYEFDLGCYYIDPLGSEAMKSGWAFVLDEEAHGEGEGNACSGKGLLEGPVACAQEPCTGHLPSEGTAQAAYCEVAPDCDTLEQASLSCEVPSLPRPDMPECPSDAVALPGGSCEPCDSVKTPAIECAAPLPTCDDVPVGPCPPPVRPCSNYAPGLAGEVARWVCEGGPDPCATTFLDPVEAVLCGGDGPPED